VQLTGKVALVTGAGSGIGRAAAITLAREGAKAGVLGRTQKQIEETVATIESNGGEALALLADVSQPAQMEHAVEELVARWQRLDIVFSNAGINGVWAPIEELTPEEWDQTLNINLKGAFLTLKYTVPYLKRQGGAVVICSSVNGTRIFSHAGLSAYATSKAGQVALAKMAALELAKFKIRVNVICPGWIKTEIRDNTFPRNRESIVPHITYQDGTIPLTGGKPGMPEQVADLVLFLTSDASSHISGTEMWIDGAESLLVG
jgi:NAD(P)-dependent dehydrogenase (short-subunit alcohol dehydrogenase family)